MKILNIVLLIYSMSMFFDSCTCSDNFDIFPNKALQKEQKALQKEKRLCNTQISKIKNFKNPKTRIRYIKKNINSFSKKVSSGIISYVIQNYKEILEAEASPLDYFRYSKTNLLGFLKDINEILDLSKNKYSEEAIKKIKTDNYFDCDSAFRCGKILGLDQIFYKDKVINVLNNKDTSDSEKVEIYSKLSEIGFEIDISFAKNLESTLCTLKGMDACFLSSLYVNYCSAEQIKSFLDDLKNKENFSFFSDLILLNLFYSNNQSKNDLIATVQSNMRLDKKDFWSGFYNQKSEIDLLEYLFSNIDSVDIESAGKFLIFLTKDRFLIKESHTKEERKRKEKILFSLCKIGIKHAVKNKKITTILEEILKSSFCINRDYETLDYDLIDFSKINSDDDVINIKNIIKILEFFVHPSEIVTLSKKALEHLDMKNDFVSKVLEKLITTNECKIWRNKSFEVQKNDMHKISHAYANHCLKRIENQCNFDFEKSLYIKNSMFDKKFIVNILDKLFISYKDCTSNNFFKELNVPILKLFNFLSGAFSDIIIKNSFFRLNKEKYSKDTLYKKFIIDFYYERYIISTIKFLPIKELTEIVTDEFYNNNYNLRDKSFEIINEAINNRIELDKARYISNGFFKLYSDKRNEFLNKKNKYISFLFKIKDSNGILDKIFNLELENILSDTSKDIICNILKSMSNFHITNENMHESLRKKVLLLLNLDNTNNNGIINFICNHNGYEVRLIFQNALNNNEIAQWANIFPALNAIVQHKNNRNVDHLYLKDNPPFYEKHIEKYKDIIQKGHPVKALLNEEINKISNHGDEKIRFSNSKNQEGRVNLLKYMMEKIFHPDNTFFPWFSKQIEFALVFLKDHNNFPNSDDSENEYLLRLKTYLDSTIIEASRSYSISGSNLSDKEILTYLSNQNLSSMCSAGFKQLLDQKLEELYVISNQVTSNKATSSQIISSQTEKKIQIGLLFQASVEKISNSADFKNTSNNWQDIEENFRGMLRDSGETSDKKIEDNMFFLKNLFEENKAEQIAKNNTEQQQMIIENQNIDNAVIASLSMSQNNIALNILQNNKMDIEHS